MAIKGAAIGALGTPVLSVLAFEALLNASAMFNHANARLPARIDRVLRWVVVTPDMHRVHHSAGPAETNSNFGFNFPWWDRLFGTYRAEPGDGHQGMTLGLSQFRDPERLTLPWLLALPLVTRISERANRPSPTRSPSPGTKPREFASRLHG
jgi:sterol desaturase/sphingolipid hydroxylase (fatty acid hydroxylase superfamily)